MDISEFRDLGRVAYITGNVKEALDAWQALERVVEIANSAQQLKAEIAALIPEFCVLTESGNWTDEAVELFINKLRQLSAV